MRVRVLAAAIVAATLTFGSVIQVAGPAAASPPVVSAVSEAVVNEAEYEFVLWLALYDESAMVRTAAWAAVDEKDKNVPEKIRQFFESEWDAAKSLSDNSRERNKEFVAYVVATCVPAYAPEVCAAARAASRGTAAQQTAFVRTGYAAAKERDRRFRAATGAQAAALVQADRSYVAVLRDNDPGAQVRLAAAWALRDGATDGDLVEFFSHGWAYSAGLDVRAHRTELAANAKQWKRNLEDLTVTAKDAELKARVAAGEAAAQERARATQAWRSAVETAGQARVAWQNAEQVALAQAEVWRQIAAAAAAGSANWQPILGASTGIGGQWTAEIDLAQSQAAYWAGLYEKAVAAEHAWAQTPA